MADYQKPIVTLIIASSVDGCMVGRESDQYDPNSKWKYSQKIRGYVQQFFDFSPQNSRVYNFINSYTLENLGVNSQDFNPKKSEVKLIVLDLDNRITLLGINNVALSVKKLILIKQKDKIDKKVKLPKNCQQILIEKSFEIASILKILKKKHKVSEITVQSAGVANSRWLASGLVDFLTVILYPIMVGNNGTQILKDEELFKVRPLKLLDLKSFDTNYLFLRYQVLN